MASKKQAGRPATKKRSFHQELVLNRWVPGFFQGGTLSALKARLGDDRFLQHRKAAVGVRRQHGIRRGVRHSDRCELPCRLPEQRRANQALADRPDCGQGADSRRQGPQQFRRTLHAVVGRHIITNSSADFLCVWVWLANSQPALRASRPYVLDTAQQTLQYSLLTMKSIPHQPLPQ